MMRPTLRRGRMRGRVIAAWCGALVLLLVTVQSVVGRTDASLTAETKNPTNQFATTTLPAPTVVSSHTSVTGGYVTAPRPSSPPRFATSNETQRPTPASGPVPTVP